MSLKLRLCGGLAAAAALWIAASGVQATPAASWAGYGDPSPEEQQFLELLNAMRANPAPHSARLGVDLNAGGAFSVGPRQPLVLNARLSAAAKAHSRAMNDKRFFSHVDPGGGTPGQRIKATGYMWSEYQENITAIVPTPAEALDRLIIDEGTPGLTHRVSLLALKPNLEALDEAGLGFVSGNGPYSHYYTNELAKDAEEGQFLLGVVFRDLDGDRAYDPGEGLPGVRIRTEPGDAETVTASAGGYGLPLGGGAYSVIASGGGLPMEQRRTVNIGAVNVKADFIVAGARPAVPPVKPALPPGIQPPFNDFPAAPSKPSATPVKPTASKPAVKKPAAKKPPARKPAPKKPVKR